MESGSKDKSNLYKNRDMLKIVKDFWGYVVLSSLEYYW